MGKNLIRSIFLNQDQPIECEIKGTVPEWLNGTLFRNGPGRFRFGEKVYNHFFDGMATINKFQIVNGKVFFTNKVLETNTLKQNLKKDNLAATFGTIDPCSRLFDRFKMIFHSPSREKLFELDNANVNVVPFANNQVYALTETSMLVKVNPKNLSVIKTENVYKKMYPTLTSIAHPHVEHDGSWISIGMRPMSLNITYDIMRYEAKNSNDVFDNAKLICQIPSSHTFGLSYFHSFALSQNFIIFLEQSLILDIKKVLWNQILNKPPANALKMNPNFQTQIHLVDRKTGKIYPKKFYTDVQVTFHHINSYEIYETDPERHEIFIDICSYSDFNIGIFNYNENEEDQVSAFDKLEKKPLPRRISVPLYKQPDKTGKIYCEIKDLSSATMELPTINYAKYNAAPYSYAYGHGGYGTGDPPYSIIKLNVNDKNDLKTAVIYSDNRIIYPSEPVFVENPNATSEDDGVILSLVLGDKYDFLIILDAKTFKEIGRAELPENIKATYSFHGFFSNNEAFN